MQQGSVIRFTSTYNAHKNSLRSVAQGDSLIRARQKLVTQFQSG